MVVSKRKQPKSKSNQVTKHKQVRKSTVSKAKTRSSGLTVSSAKQCRSILSDHGQGDVAVIQVGTNDIRESSKSELVELYKSLIDTIKRVAPKAKHIICAVPHRLGA